MSQQNITVLLIEDNPGDARLIELLLSGVAAGRSTGAEFNLLQADRLAAGLDRLATEAVDVILLDLSLPDSHGLDTFHQIHAQAPYTPTILLTGLDDETVGFKAVQAGAQDYLVKGEFDLEILQRVILYAIERQSLLTQLEEQTLAALQSEARFQTMIEHNADGIVIVDHSGLVRFVNPATERLFGQTTDELLDRPLDFPLNTEERTEIDIDRPDGRSLVVEMQAVETEWENTGAFLISLRDITERKRMEEALAESEERYRSLIETSPDAITLTDFEGQILLSNQQAAVLHGYENPDEVIGQNAFELIAPKDRQRAAENAQKALEQGMIKDIEYTMLRQDGSRFPAELSASVIKDNAGQPKAFISVVRDITARKQAAEEIRRQKDILQSILDNMQAGVVMANKQGKFMLFNPAAEKILGQDAVDTTPDQWSDQYGVFYPDQVTPFPAEKLPLAQAIQGQASHGQELFIRRKKQPEGVFILVNGKPLLDASGAVRGGLAVFHDITEQKRAEEAIKQRNRELSLLNQVIAASAEAIEQPDTVQDIACRELAQTLNVGRASIFLYNPAKTELRITAEYGLEDDPGALDQAVSAGPASQHLLTHKKPLVINDVLNDERMAPFHDRFQRHGVRSMLLTPLIVAGQVRGALAVADSDPHCFSATEIELTRSVAEQVAGGLERSTLSKERQRLSAALEQSAESVTIINPKGKVVYVNPAFEQLSGYTAAEVIDQDHFAIKTNQQIWKRMKAGQIWQGRLNKRKKDGAQYTVDVTISPVRNEDGTIINYVESGRDITRELELEEQFRQSQKMEAVGRLAGGVAHDFNNLLTVITGYTELLLHKRCEDESLGKDLTQIQKASAKAAKLVSQLLAFSRKQVSEFKNLNLNDIITDIVKMLGRLIGEDIDLMIRLDPEAGIIEADPNQIEQVIINLAVNARDAMPDGGQLIIETSNIDLNEMYAFDQIETKPGPYVMLTISDTGIGMDYETRSSIFEPFFTTKEVGEGTGLGLATVYGIVKQCGGHIRVYSEVGWGTTFKLYFPRLEEAASGAQTAVDSNQNYGGAETLLVVEDEQTVRKLIGLTLQAQGYTILEATNGPEALDICHRHPDSIHLLLTDLIMPGGLNGKELADQLSHRYPAMEVIFMSGYSDSIVQDVLSEEAHFIQKPFSPTSLLRTIRKVLDKQEA